MEESLEVSAELTELRDYLEAAIAAIWMTYPAEAMVPGG